MKHAQFGQNPFPEVAVIGAGIMGRGIALVAACSGSRVTLIDQSCDSLVSALEYARTDLDHPRSRHRSESGIILDRIGVSRDIADVAGADVVIEAVPEFLGLKREVFAQLEEICSPSALLATNTSALSVSEISQQLADPSRFIGMHFFNPVPRMRLVEVVVGRSTSDETITRAEALTTALDKVSVRVADHPGFVTSRINVLIGNEAFRMLTEAVATADDIDTALKLGLNHPMGPFELADLVGLDTRLSVLRRMHDALGERFRPDPTLVALVEAGHLGRKSGRGVYLYDDTGRRVTGAAGAEK